MKQAEKSGKNNKIGAYGEVIAANYVKRRGFAVVEVNYLKKWGEIDIVAHETGSNPRKIRFIEVKTVSYETKDDLNRAISKNIWRPEENVTREKILKLNRAIESWFQDNRKYSEFDWQIDVAAVRIVPREKYATIKYFENVIL